MTYVELESRVEKLRDDANLEQAINEVNQFMLEDHSLDDISKAEQLLISLENQQQTGSSSGPVTDGFATDLAIIRSELEIGEVEHAFDGVRRLLQEQPQNPEVQALLREVVQQDRLFRAQAERVVQEVGLDASILDQSADRPAAPPAKRSAPAGPAPTGLSPSGPVFEKYQEGMRLYRTRYHERAIEIFEELLHQAEPDSQIYLDAVEYRQKAEERLLAGEVPLDNIPHTAVDKQSQATSAIRLGDYESAIKLLEAAIQECMQAQVRYPPDWNAQFQSAREIHMAYKIKEKGDIALSNGNLESAKQYWTNAQKVLEDVELEQNLQDLQAARAAIADGEILVGTLIGPSNDQQIRQLISAMQALQKARTTFPQVEALEETLKAVQQKAFRIRESLNEEGESYLEEARHSAVLSDRRKWLESALGEFELARVLSGDTGADFNMNRTRQMLQMQTDLENRLQEADMLLQQSDGDSGDLATVLTYLRDVKEAVPNDPQVRLLSRRLRDQYLANAEQRLDHLNGQADLRQAEEYVRTASNEFFGSPSEKLNSLRARIRDVKQAQQRKAALMSVLGIGAAIIIIVPLGFLFGSQVVLPMFAPTATPTATYTPTPTSTPTGTSTPTITPTPTQTPIILFGLSVSQVWVYNQPSENTGERVGFLLRDQPVEVVESVTDEDGAEWYRIRWVNQDLRNEGWIQAANIRVIGTN